MFSVGNHFIQLASTNDNEIYCEAVSHHFLDTLDPNLESGFRALGFNLDNGSNYYKTYHVNSELDYDGIIKDTEVIFKQYYREAFSFLFEVEDVA